MSAYTTVTFDGATAVQDIDTQVLGLDARKCAVVPLDSDNDFKTIGLTETRPDASTIRLTQGTATALSLRVLIFEAKD